MNLKKTQTGEVTQDTDPLLATILSPQTTVNSTVVKDSASTTASASLAQTLKQFDAQLLTIATTLNQFEAQLQQVARQLNDLETHTHKPPAAAETTTQNSEETEEKAKKREKLNRFNDRMNAIQDLKELVITTLKNIYFLAVPLVMLLTLAMPKETKALLDAVEAFKTEISTIVTSDEPYQSKIKAINGVVKKRILSEEPPATPATAPATKNAQSHSHAPDHAQARDDNHHPTTDKPHDDKSDNSNKSKN